MRRDLAYIQVIIVIAASLIYLGFRSLPAQKKIDAPVEKKGGYFFVKRVVDGDTITLSDGRKVRLIGVDTPEVHYSDKLLRDARKSHKDIKTIQRIGSRASDFTRSLCQNKNVRLEFDVQQYDRYGRTLAYVYLEDGTFVNARIVEAGYGQVLTIPPNVKNAGFFRKLQEEAMKDRRGIWNEG